MKNFKQHILESSLSRIFSYTKNRNIAIISGQRGNLTPKENAVRTANLKSEIRKLFGFITVKGRFIENKGTSEEKVVDEISFLVIGSEDDDKGLLLGFIKKMGEKYQQDSVLYKSYDSEFASLIGTTEGQFPGKGIKHILGKFQPNTISDFKSVLKGDSKTFTENNQQLIYELEGCFIGGDSFFSREERFF